MIVNGHTCWWCQTTLAMNHNLKTNNLDNNFESQALIFYTSSKIFHLMMNIGVMGLIAQKDLCFVSSFTVMLYGVIFTIFPNSFQMQESSVREAVSRLAHGVLKIKNHIRIFWGQWQKVMHQRWQNCTMIYMVSTEWLVAWIACMFSGKIAYMHFVDIICEKMESLQWLLRKAVMTIVFWHHKFRHAGVLNDLNIWDWSQLHIFFWMEHWKKWTVSLRLMNNN